MMEKYLKQKETASNFIQFINMSDVSPNKVNFSLEKKSTKYFNHMAPNFRDDFRR
jgi:hypothetical protein